MTVECPQWKECGVAGGGCCALGKYGGKPSRGTCIEKCADYPGERVILSPPGPPAPLPDPLPRSEWPIVVKLIAQLERPGEKGLGDTLHNQTTILGVDWARKTIGALKLIGIDCGCDERIAWLNARFPYAPAAGDATASDTQAAP